MSTAADSPGTSSEVRTLRRHVEEVVLILLVALSGLGVAINDYSPQSAFRYWLWMAPTFGVISITAAWWRAHRRDESVSNAIWRQVMHWAGVVGAVYLIYLLQRTGRMTNEAAGLGALITVALSTFLAGAHSDWRLMVVGVVLGVTVVGFAILEQLIWIVVLPLLVIIIIAMVLYMRRARG